MRRWRPDRLEVARWALCVLIAALAVANAAFEKAWARDTGSLSRADLRSVSDFMRHEVATGQIAGAIVLIQQHGHPVYFEKFGLRDIGPKLPITDDTIFRLYSMSKPVTSVAAMMLVDDGKLSLDDPVANIFQPLRIWRSVSKGTTGLERRCLRASR